MGTRKSPTPRTILGNENMGIVALKPQEQQPPQSEKPIKPTALQTWIGSIGLAIWMWWMVIAWGMVVVAALNLAFEPPFWYWLAFALLGIGFRFVLESWGAKVQSINEDDYDPSHYPWWARKIRLSHKEKP